MMVKRLHTPRAKRKQKNRLFAKHWPKQQNYAAGMFVLKQVFIWQCAKNKATAYWFIC